MEKGKSKFTKAFLISLVILLLVSFINWGVVTGFGKVDVTRLTLVGEDGLEYSALIYVPDTATGETPAPAVLCFHGNSGNARNHESWAVEFSRRGYVVLAIDNFGSGDSQYNAKYDEAKHQMVTVAKHFTKYLLSQNFVDPNRIVSTGHSLGGNTAYLIGREFQTAAVISSDGRWWMDGTETEQYHGNYAHIVGSSDDKCPRKKMMDAALKSYQTNGYDIQELEIGKLYGSFEKGNACIYVEIPNQIHEGAFVNSDHIEALLDFAMKSVEPVNYIAPSEQIWVVKDFTGLAGMVAFVISMILFALMLTEKVPFFAAVRQPLPRNIGLRKVGLAISIICGLLFPFIVLRTGCFGLVSLIGGTGSSVPAHLSIFPLHFSGIALAVIVGCTILGCITMILFLLTDGKKAKATIADLGLTPANNTHIVWSFIGKSFLLAVITAALGWTYLKLQGDMLGTDFYCQFFGYKPIPAVKFGTYIGYIIVWIIAFLISSIGMNVERRLPSTGSETKDTVIAVIVNAFIAAFTVTFLLSLQNKLQIDAQGASTIWSNWGLDVTRLWGMPVGMSIGAAGQTFIYRKTGNLWLGAFLMGIICALGCVLYGQLRFGIAG